MRYPAATFATARSSNLLFNTNSTSLSQGPGTGSWARFPGTLDDVALWDDAMTFGEAKALYNTELCKVSVVGVGMRVHTGVAQRMFKALADAKVNIQNITTSEIKISCIISKEDGPKALQIVHDAFELHKTH